MPGKVYCFNCYNETIKTFNVNGFPTSSIGGWQTSGDTIYTPVALAIARSRHSDGQTVGTFPNDLPTPLRIDWSSFTTTTEIDTTNLPNVSLDDDLILYIAVNRLTLMTTRGFVLRTVDTKPRGLTAEGEEALASMAEPEAST